MYTKRVAKNKYGLSINDFLLFTLGLFWSLNNFQGAKKGKQIASSTKWKWGENIVLLMECLFLSFSFDIFMDNYFTSFLLLAHLGVDNIRATGVLKKNRLCKCTIIWDKRLQKKGTWPLWTAPIKIRSSVTLRVVD